MGSRWPDILFSLYVYDCMYLYKKKKVRIYIDLSLFVPYYTDCYGTETTQQIQTVIASNARVGA